MEMGVRNVTQAATENSAIYFTSTEIGDWRPQAFQVISLTYCKPKIQRN